jgi:hypothetical protein
MVEYHSIYEINVLDDMVMPARDRSRFDTLRQRKDRARRNEALLAAQLVTDKEKGNAEQKETRANWTPARREEDAQYMASYHQNRMAAMADEEREGTTSTSKAESQEGG